MNESQLRDELLDAYNGVQLKDPLDKIMRRGKAVHRARRAPLLGLLAAVSAGALVIASPLGSTPSAFATWSENPTPISSRDAAAIAGQCANAFPDMPPLALVDARGDVAFSLFVGKGKVGECTVIKHNGSWINGTAGSGLNDITGRQDVLNGATALGLEGSADLNNVHDRSQAASAWGWVAPDVASVVVRADGRTSKATIHGGAFAAWWPHDSDASRGGAVTAYDAAGRQLAQVTIAGFGQSG
jgi:hypothetical protein